MASGELVHQVDELDVFLVHLVDVNAEFAWIPLENMCHDGLLQFECISYRPTRSKMEL